MNGCNLPERHLGLIPGSEHKNAAERVEAMRRAVNEYVDVEAILALARENAKSMSPLSGDRGDVFVPAAAGAALGEQALLSSLNLGIFRDAAFNFYYPDDLEALERAGFKLVPINSLCDTALPDINALFIGGGFPETHAEQLQANAALRTAVRDAIENGLPTYAECGGADVSEP